MTVLANNDYVIRQTKQRFNYQSGNSHLIELTYSNIAPQTNVLKRVGYFSSSIVAPYDTTLDGDFIESLSGIVYLCIYRSGTEILKVPQSSWNIDKMDGTGASGVTLDFTKGQIFEIDFLWLSLGRVRFGFNIGGQIITVHEHNTANVSDNTYMSSPNQPIRYEIRSTGGTGTLKHICSTVKTEGNDVTLGIDTALGIYASTTNYALSGTRYAALGVRLKSTHLDVSVGVSSIALLGSSNDDYHWELLLNPTVTGVFTYNAVSNSAVEYAIGLGTPTASGGYLMASGYGRQATAIEIAVNLAIKLGASINGTRDTIVLCITPLSAALNCYSSMNIHEKL
jgi:hypothetical protein